MPHIAWADAPIDPEEELAYNLGVQAFIYGAGPLTVSAVRETTTSVDAPMDNAMAPLNKMGKTRVLSGPQDQIVPTVNNDTLYSQAHYDLDIAGPMVLELPKTDDRYFIVQLLDAYSDLLPICIATTPALTAQSIFWSTEVGVDKYLRVSMV